eukprot:3681043-Amphidinium_carterae.1
MPHVFATIKHAFVKTRDGKPCHYVTKVSISLSCAFLFLQAHIDGVVSAPCARCAVLAVITPEPCLSKSKVRLSNCCASAKRHDA